MVETAAAPANVAHAQHLPAGCTVRALGHRAGVYVLRSPSGERRALPAEDLASPAGLLSLFDGRADILAACWPRRGRRLGFDADRAAAQLMRACAARGLIP